MENQENDGLDELVDKKIVLDNPNYKPIVCPRCGSRNIAFVTEYHKAIAAKVFLILFVAALIINYGDMLIRGITFQNADASLLIEFLLGAFALALTIYIFVEESKTHVQGICRNCGVLWLLN